MPFIDSHVHFPLLDSSVKEILKLCSTNGIQLFLNAAYDYESSLQSCKLSRAFPEIYASIGIHPHYVSQNQIDQLGRWLQNDQLVSFPKLIALGEIGLDYVRSATDKKDQQYFFDLQLQWALKLKIPVIIHNREADTDMTLHLEKYPELRGVMHCYSSLDQAFTQRILSLGFMISFAGNLTYPTAEKLRNIARTIPLDRLLLETDAPYLAPQAQRGSKNHPMNVLLVYQCMAELKQMPLTELQHQVYHNFCRFFHLK